MSAFRAALTVAGVALTVASHPAVRAGIRAAAPRLIAPAVREKAGDMALDVAYRAGVAARRIVTRKVG